MEYHLVFYFFFFNLAVRFERSPINLLITSSFCFVYHIFKSQASFCFVFHKQLLYRYKTGLQPAQLF